MSMVEVVIPVSSPIPATCVEESTKISAEISRVLDRIENIWDGPGGPTALRDAIQNILGLARSKVIMWLDSLEDTARRSGLGAGIPSQSPGNVVASVGNSNPNNPVPYNAQRIYNKLKARLSSMFSKQGTGGIPLADIDKARIVLDLVFQRVKQQYGCDFGIAHTNVAE